ncbi:MAG TPA: superoxide dismutase [Chitinophagaceae bacterium]|nr:superoxide dismutase [Chitinophagaceae bacterium]
MQNNSKSRRQFIIESSKAGLALGLGATVLQSCSTAKKVSGTIATTPFHQQPLPYSYNALEPTIDSMTMEIHYTRHASAYAKNLSEAAAAEGVDTSKPLEDVLARISKFTTKMRNNGGGHYNHELFWKCMRARRDNNRPAGKLLSSIESSFNSFDAFKTQFSDAAKNRFGSGWAWLIADNDNRLRIGSTPNQDNPLMDVSDVKGFPLLGLDVWEHAYYLKYQNRRPEYVENWWSVVNWDYVQDRFAKM